MKIGVLALQGAFIEHEKKLIECGAEVFKIRQRRDIEHSFDGLILPGGESTVMGKLLHELEGNFRKIAGSSRIYLRVTVTPDDTPQEKKIYMPGDQAVWLMAHNEEVNNLVKALDLDVK